MRNFKLIEGTARVVDTKSYAPVGPRPGEKPGFKTKDSGARIDYESGMRRDVQDGKPRYDLIPVMPHRRLAELYTRGAEKYGDHNWELANSPDEVERFRGSAERHFMQWKAREDDEDHAIACVWNIFAALYVEAKIAHSDDENNERHPVM